MIRKVLIANRGEIACRIVRTCQEMGIATVAVYSDADVQALHVEMADEAVHIGGAKALESYLDGDTIIQAAKRVGAQAIHPGYGFLAENATFAYNVKANDLIFIGPPPEAIEAMGDKRIAKLILQDVPSYPATQATTKATKHLSVPPMTSAILS
jgi:3-methylcrotonyl-CoA carboxylase alpha subunit